MGGGHCLHCPAYAPCDMVMVCVCGGEGGNREDHCLAHWPWYTPGPPLYWDV